MNRVHHFVVAALVAQVTSGAALAQDSRPERPYRGIFGSGTSDAEEVLTVGGSAGAGFDTDVLADAHSAGVGDGVPPASTDGGYGMLAGNLNYSRSKLRNSFGASAGASSRYYPTLGQSFVTAYSGAASASWSPTARTRVGVNGSIGYQPFSLYSLFPEFQQLPAGTVFLTDLDFNTLQTGYFSYASGINVGHRFSQRSTISAGYSYDRSNFPSRYPDFWTHNGNVRYSRSLTADLGLRLGYGYSQGHYGGLDARAVDRHFIDTGVDYNKTLSVSRRTTLAFSTGGTVVTDRSTTRVGAVGSANLNHEMGRTWSFSAAYNRDVGFVETFSAPFFYDAVNVGLNGLFNRRLQFHAGAGAVLGTLGLHSDASTSNAFDTAYASTGLSMAINRFLSLGVDYSFYHYAFDQNALLPTGIVDDLNRHSVRATLNAWKPIFQHGRRSNATR